MSGANPGGQGVVGNDLGSLVDNAIRGVLGWKPDTKDPKGFVKALRRSFEGQVKDGRTEWILKPHVYAADAELSGGVSGIQTGLLTRARDVVEKVIPLLGGLESLDPNFSEDNKQVLSEPIQSNLQELVQEFATPGGPRIPKVDHLFACLLGIPADDPNDPAHDPNDNQAIKNCLIGNLREKMKLTYKTYKAPNTKAETDQANYRILADYIIGLREAWWKEKEQILAPDMPVGVQLIKISRHLAVLSESVQEVRTACDEDGLNAGRRLTIDLKDSGSKQEITLEALLAWIQEFATADGPRLVEDGGKEFSKEDFKETVKRLEQWVGKSVTRVAGEVSSGATGATAKSSLDNLKDGLEALKKVVT